MGDIEDADEPGDIDEQGDTENIDYTEIPANRKNVSFTVDGLKIKAWLYLPKNAGSSYLCVIMSQGFGGTKDIDLELYALRFADNVMAVLTYDYRYFGESEGNPRQMFSIQSQIEDLKAAIEYIRGLESINPDRIALWGTSAGGGHPIIIASEDKKLHVQYLNVLLLIKRRMLK
jgi:cephalosporin-C deacetylase-like acetyl esterase